MLSVTIVKTILSDTLSGKSIWSELGLAMMTGTLECAISEHTPAAATTPQTQPKWKVVFPEKSHTVAMATYLFYRDKDYFRPY